jgi:hypothetical protein
MRLCERPDTQGARGDAGLRPAGPAWQDVPVSTFTRRGFLRALLGVTGAAGIGLTGGCGLLGGSDPGPPPPDPLLGFLVDTNVLVGLYDAALARVPSLGPAIATVRNNHRAHATVLAKAINGPTPGPTGGPSGAPQDRATVLAALVEAETKAHDAAIEACLGATARLAPLVGSIAAARATHLEVLR